MVPDGSGTTINKKTHKITHIQNNTKHTKLQTQLSTCTTHIKNTNWEFQPNKETKVEESALTTIWHRPYCRVIN
jgi:hypothetical protein